MKTSQTLLAFAAMILSFLHVQASTLSLGCTDPLACNYDETATFPDGSCTYDTGVSFPTPTYHWELQFNFTGGSSGNTTLAFSNDQTWNLVGGTNTGTWKQCDGTLTRWFDATTTVYVGTWNGSQFVGNIFDQEDGVIFGSFTMSPIVAFGCTDSLACNYDDTATEDNGSCTYPGCTDSNATNYDATAGCDDLSCTYPPAQSLDFDGNNDHVQAPSVNWDSDVSFTFEAWVYPRTGGILISNSSTSGDRKGFLWRVTNDGAQGFNLTGAHGSDDQLSAQTAETVPFNQWVHLAVTYDGSGTADGITFFQDGVEQSIASSQDLLTVSTVSEENVFIGRRPGGTNDMDVIMDQMAIWSPAVCNNQVSTRSHCALDGTEPGLHALFTFNQGDAGGDNNGETTLLDATGNGQDGTLVNFSLSGTASNFIYDNFELDGSCTTVYAGCIDPTACNYDAMASCDDGSCAYVSGCTDPYACNFDPLAICDDGTCIEGGCLDPAAANYDAAAPCDNGTCILPATSLHFDGSDDRVVLQNNINWDGEEPFSMEAWVHLEDYSGVLISTSLAGENSRRGFQWRMKSDNTMELLISYFYSVGLRLSAESNLSVPLNTDVHLAVTYGGGSDPSTIRFYVDGVDVGSTVVHDNLGFNDASPTKPQIGHRPGASNTYFKGWMNEMVLWNSERSATDIANGMQCAPCLDDPDLRAWYDFDQGTGNSDNSGETELQDRSGNGREGDLQNFALDGLTSNWSIQGASKFGNCTEGVYGCTDPSACNYDALATCGDDSCILPDGCTSATACNYDPSALCDDGSCEEPDGCTDAAACNYDAGALCDDGSCGYPGCMDSEALNYDMTAICDDGNCTYVGESGRFNFNSKITFPTMDAYDPFTDNTVQISIKPEVYNRQILSAGDPEFNSGLVFWLDPDGHLVLTFTSSSFTPADLSSTSTVRSTEVIPLDAWTTVGFTRKAADALHETQLYINGVASNAEVVAAAESGFTDYEGFTLGRGFDNLPGYRGSLDEFHIWNEALCEDLMLAQFGCEPKASAALVHRYTFNQGVAEGDNTALTELEDIGSSPAPGFFDNFSLDGDNSNFVGNGLELSTSCGGISVGCTDASALNYDATVTCDDGSCQYPGRSLHFNGASDVVETPAVTWDSDQRMTFESWVNMPQQGILISNSNVSTPNRPGFLVRVDSDLRLKLELRHDNTTDDAIIVRSMPSVTLNAWQHMAVSYDGSGDASGVRIFLDGVEVMTETTNNSLTGSTVSTDPVIIGDRPNGVNNFIGNMDEVRLWTEALCENSIAGRMHCELDGDEEGLYAYYTFNQGASNADNSGVTTATDSGPNGLDGTLLNFVLDGLISNWSSDENLNLTACAAVVFGCTDQVALNYDATATCDNGTCGYEGCTDPAFCNYNPAAIVDDGSCDGLPGCDDVTACNYSADVDCNDGSCDYTDSDGDGIYDCFDNCPTLANPDQADWNVDGIGDMCQDSDGDGLSDALELSNGTDPGLTDSDDNGMSDLSEFCPDFDAQGYGCTYPDATNYDPNATLDDGTCDFVLDICREDITGDNLIGTADLLALLSSFGAMCP